jgi:uncharacterized protein (TIGR02284 family)
MEKEKTIEVLNSLITINNERIDGYETASKETLEEDLKALFSKLSSTSHKCKEKLKTEVHKLGGTPSDGSMIAGKFFRVWMDVKAALTGKDRKGILNSCEYGEDVAKKTYEKALKNDVADLSKEVYNLIKSQYALLVADHDTVKSMRDALVAVK